MITIDNLIRVKRTRQINKLIPIIKSTFTHYNPQYFKLRSMGKDIRYVPMTLQTYFIFRDYIGVPRGYFKQLKGILDDNKIKYQINDNRVICGKINVELTEALEKRTYQEKIVKQLRSYSQQILIGPTASGKTVMILWLISIIRQPTLIITQRGMLLNQWKSEIKKYLSYDFKIGQIGNGIYKLGPITIAMVQSLMRLNKSDWETINKSFGMIVNEEVQHASATENFKVLNKLKAKYRYGITATIKRKDQLEFLTYASLGKKIVTISKDEEDVQKKRITPTLKFIYDKNFKTEDDDEIIWPTIISQIAENKKRNKHILSEVKKDVTKKHYVLVLTERVEHCIELYNTFPDKKIAKPLIGAMDDSLRDKIKNAIKDGKVKVLFATRGLASEGLDIPRLSSLHLVTPSNNAGLLEQMVGRITRSFEKKGGAIVKDYVDLNSSYLKALGKKRLKYYKKMGIKWEEDNVNYLSKKDS